MNRVEKGFMLSPFQLDWMSQLSAPVLSLFSQRGSRLVSARQSPPGVRSPGGSPSVPRAEGLSGHFAILHHRELVKTNELLKKLVEDMPSIVERAVMERLSSDLREMASKELWGNSSSPFLRQSSMQDMIQGVLSDISSKIESKDREETQRETTLSDKIDKLQDDMNSGFRLLQQNVSEIQVLKSKFVNSGIQNNDIMKNKSEEMKENDILGELEKGKQNKNLSYDTGDKMNKFYGFGMNSENNNNNNNEADQLRKNIIPIGISATSLTGKNNEEKIDKIVSQLIVIRSDITKARNTIISAIQESIDTSVDKLKRTLKTEFQLLGNSISSLSSSIEETNRILKASLANSESSKSSDFDLMMESDKGV